MNPNKRIPRDGETVWRFQQRTKSHFRSRFRLCHFPSLMNAFVCSQNLLRKDGGSRDEKRTLIHNVLAFQVESWKTFVFPEAAAQKIIYKNLRRATKAEGRPHHGNRKAF